jgi:hypothetical protein
VGSEAKIRSVAGTLQLDLGTIQIVEIVDIDNSRMAAIRAVEMARKGEVQMPMKGSLIGPGHFEPRQVLVFGQQGKSGASCCK